jgi:hypothetical protein
MPVWADDEHPPLCEAYVYSDRAEFLFPVLDMDTWRWFRQETPVETLEYAWEMMVPAQRPHHVFGIYLAKSAGAKQQSGDLKTLLDQTSWNAAKLHYEKDQNVRVEILPHLKLSLHLEYGGVVLGLMGEESVKALFNTKPTEVRFKLVHPDELFSTTCVALVHYRAPNDQGRGERLVPKGQQPLSGNSGQERPASRSEAFLNL